MDSRDREFLRSNRREICLIDFDAPNVASKLHELGILSKNENEMISLEEKDLRQKERLLDILPRRGPKAFAKFIETAKELRILKLYKILGGDPALYGDGESKVSSEETDKTKMEDDRTDGPPRQLPLKEQNPDDEKPTEDTVDTPPETETDGRPSLFGGSGKKKTKTSSTSEGDERVPLSPSSFIEAPIDLKECYAMQSTPRGHFILVNNKHFLPSSGMENYPRNGTDVDGAAITELFQEMGFLVEAHSNLSVYEMRKVFKQAAHKDYSGVSCLTCCILSHGQEGVIYGTDGTIEIREITSFFHGTNLSGKPKLFFFQACQGSDYMDSVTPDEVMETDGPASEGNDITLPSEADFLYAYSTVPGYYSWRNSQRGSWFIQSICEVFRKHAHKMDVVRMLTRVNAIVSTKKSQTGQRASHHKRQISSIVTQLRKELYFFPMHGPLATYQGNY